MAIDHTKLSYRHLGNWVRFDQQHGESRFGRLKTWNEKYVFVVFSCGGDWDNWHNYTGQSCNPDDCAFVDKPTNDWHRIFGN